MNEGEERPAAERVDKEKEALRRELRRIQERVSRLPVLDDRTPEEILGYDENGLPT